MEEVMFGKGLVLLSGGLDSSVTAYYANKECRELNAITFEYGQTHSREIQSAIDIGQKLDLRRHMLFPISLNMIGGSSLFDKKTIPTGGVGKDIPTTWVPQRNSIFLAIAFGYAEVVGAEVIYIGVNVVDFSGYPDCRPIFVEYMENALNLASKRCVEEDKRIFIEAPISNKSKKDIILLGKELGVPFELTWSCYLGDDKPCGTCDSCLLRLKGFEEAGLVDPLIYRR